MSQEHRISGGSLAASIKADGAELCHLTDVAGRDLLWGAGPQWPNHSPVLFPVVGQVTEDRILVGGRPYPMGRHGFARRRQFEWMNRGADACRLQLRDDAWTHAVFPFPFRLTLSYRIADDALHVEYEVANPGQEALPASLGAHPAFRWPLHGGTQTDYRIEFAKPEPEPIRRLDDGLIRPAKQPSPVQGRTLPLDPALFHDDAIIMLHPRSTGLRYVGPDGGIEVTWHGFPQLGLWQKPGAELLCIEPWHGYASPAGWDGEFRDKPGLMLIPPGESRTMGWSVRPLPG